MKTYRNERHGFEIDIPEDWEPAPAAVYTAIGVIFGSMAKKIGKDVFQYGCRNEAVNFEIGPLSPEPLLDDTETEFTLYARDHGFANLKFGQIMVAGKEHVCASYFIADSMGIRWNKKYMVVLGGIEYAITATCNDPAWFVQREKDWDAIIQTFRMVIPVADAASNSDRASRNLEKRREIIQERIEMRETLGDLYAQAYDAGALGNYVQARALLEKCIQNEPDHVLAHKELAVVLKKMGDITGALRQRREVYRLAPEDFVNRANLVDLLGGCGRRREALYLTREYLAKDPHDPTFRGLEKKLLAFRFTDYRLLFFSSLTMLLLLNISLFFPGYIAFRNIWCVRLLNLMPIYGMYVSGPWVGIPKIISGMFAVGLYLWFLLQTL